jgi:hypothetical protein
MLGLGWAFFVPIVDFPGNQTKLELSTSHQTTSISRG